jgi:hypothetical protein
MSGAFPRRPPPAPAGNAEFIDPLKGLVVEKALMPKNINTILKVTSELLTRESR